MNTINQDLYQPEGIIKRNLIPLTIILSFGLLLFACNEKHNPVSDFDYSEKFASTGTYNNIINSPVQILNFEITFNGVNYDDVEDETTFSYTVENIGTAGLNYIFFQTSPCANLESFTPDSGDATEVEDGIRWTSNIPHSQTREFIFTYSGDFTGEEDVEDVIYTTIRRGTDIETKLLPGPVCQTPLFPYTISGTVFEDPNDNGVLDLFKLGIKDVTVHLIKDEEVIDQMETTADGSYIFSVLTDGTITEFKVEIPETGNAFLLNYFSPTPTTGTDQTKQLVTINKKNIEDVNFGFILNTEDIISRFSSGEILLNTEDYKYWRKQLRLAINSERIPGRGHLNSEDRDIPAMDIPDVTTAKLLEWLKVIEGDDFLLPNIFKFGLDSDSDSDKLQAAYNILQTPAHTEEQILCVELLTAELNIVSGRGSGSPELDLAIAAFGEYFAAERDLCAPVNENQNSLMLNSVIETVPFTITSSATLSGSNTLLRSFNGGGGGVGSK